jgi:hypothetical protein
MLLPHPIHRTNAGYASIRVVEETQHFLSSCLAESCPVTVWVLPGRAKTAAASELLDLGW